MWDSELIVNVPCQHNTWASAKPHTSAKKPPIANVITPAATGGSIHQRSSQRSSGYFEKSLMRERSVPSRSRERIQPICDHQNPDCFTEWRSPGMSESLW